MSIMLSSTMAMACGNAAPIKQIAAAARMISLLINMLINREQRRVIFLFAFTIQSVSDRDCHASICKDSYTGRSVADRPPEKLPKQSVLPMRIVTSMLPCRLLPGSALSLGLDRQGACPTECYLTHD